MLANFKFYNLEKAEPFHVSLDDFIGENSIEIESIDSILNTESLSDIIFRVLVSDTKASKRLDLWKDLSNSYTENGAEIVDAYFDGYADNSGELEFEYTFDIEEKKILLFIRVKIEDDYISAMQNMIGNKLMA